MKPQNFVLTKIGDVKIIDLEHVVKEGEKPIASTAIFASPEAILGKEVTCSSDVWSFGVMAFETFVFVVVVFWGGAFLSN